MKDIILVIVWIVGVVCIIFGIGTLVQPSAFADISFDTQSETQWYNATYDTATVSASANPAPLPVGITVIIQQTLHSH